MSRRPKREEAHWHDGQASGYDWISRTTRIAIYLRDGDKCLACGSAEELTLDHLRRDLPAELVHKPTNLVTLCLRCNSSRRNTAADVWDAVFAELAACQVTKPLDRKRALELAKQRWPERFAKARARAAKSDAKRREARASAA